MEVKYLQEAIITQNSVVAMLQHKPQPINQGMIHVI